MLQSQTYIDKNENNNNLLMAENQQKVNKSNNEQSGKFDIAFNELFLGMNSVAGFAPMVIPDISQSKVSSGKEAISVNFDDFKLNNKSPFLEERFFRSLSDKDFLEKHFSTLKQQNSDALQSKIEMNAEYQKINSQKTLQIKESETNSSQQQNRNFDKLDRIINKEPNLMEMMSDIKISNNEASKQPQLLKIEKGLGSQNILKSEKNAISTESKTAENASAKPTTGLAQSKAASGSESNSNNSNHFPGSPGNGRIINIKTLNNKVKAGTVRSYGPMKPQEFAAKTSEMAKNLQPGTTQTARLVLNPKSLGTLLVKMTMKDSKLSIDISASTKEARQSIESQLGQLRSNLKQIGIELSEAEIRYNDSFEQELSGGNGNNANAEERQSPERMFFAGSAANMAADKKKEIELNDIKDATETEGAINQPVQEMLLNGGSLERYV